MSAFTTIERDRLAKSIFSTLCRRQHYEQSQTEHRHGPSEGFQASLDSALKRINLGASDAQKAAGNYRKGKVRLHGLTITIENPAGTKRKPEYKPLAFDYGYINRTEGRDGDHIDVFLGHDPESELVFVVDQVNPDGNFDEHKVMLGFKSEKAAKAGYLANYSDGWKVGPIVPMTMAQFKAWLEKGDTTKPAEKQIAIEPYARPKADSRSVEFRTLRNAVARILLANAVRPAVENYAKLEESQHPRGQPDNAGQFGPGGGHAETSPSKQPAADKPAAPASAPSEAKTKQPTTVKLPEKMNATQGASVKQDFSPQAGYSELRKHAEVGTEDLKNILDRGKGIGAQLGFKTVTNDQEFNAALQSPGGIVVIGPPKGEKRATEKVAQDFNGDWSKLLDASRATIAVDSTADLEAVLNHLESHNDVEVVRAKDRFNKPTDVGYRDILLNVKTRNDGIGEIQVHVKPMLQAKNEAHHHYEIMRSIAGSAALENRQMTGEEASQFQAAEAESKRLYNQAWEEANR